MVFQCDLQLKEYLHQGSPILPKARRELKRDWDQQRPLFDFTDLKNIPKNFETFWGHFTQALINAEFLDYLAET